jgi:N-acetyl-gamma-glutamylphosphate reductase
MPAKLKTAVLGATGYSGLELTRLLLRHPRLEQPALLRRHGRRCQPSGDISRTFGQRKLSAATVVVAGA